MTTPNRTPPETVYAKFEGWINFEGKDILLREGEPWPFLSPVVQKFGSWYFKIAPSGGQDA